MTIRRELAQIMHARIDDAAGDGPRDDPFRERRLHHLRKDGDDVDCHYSCSRVACCDPLLNTCGFNSSCSRVACCDPLLNTCGFNSSCSGLASDEPSLITSPVHATPRGLTAA